MRSKDAPSSSPIAIAFIPITPSSLRRMDIYPGIILSWLLIRWQTGCRMKLIFSSTPTFPVLLTLLALSTLIKILALTPSKLLNPLLEMYLKMM